MLQVSSYTTDMLRSFLQSPESVTFNFDQLTLLEDIVSRRTVLTIHNIPSYKSMSIELKFESFKLAHTYQVPPHGRPYIQLINLLI